MKDDTIYRQAAIDALFALYEYQRSIDPTEAADLVRQGIFLAEKKIEKLPSAQPKRRKGEWIVDNVETEHCSICKHRFYISALFAVGGNDEPPSCPWCGADMT